MRLRLLTNKHTTHAESQIQAYRCCNVTSVTRSYARSNTLAATAAGADHMIVVCERRESHTSTSKHYVAQRQYSQPLTSLFFTGMRAHHTAHKAQRNAVYHTQTRRKNNQWVLCCVLGHALARTSESHRPTNMDFSCTSLHTSLLFPSHRHAIRVAAQNKATVGIPPTRQE
jgi:hypothetical protein